MYGLEDIRGIATARDSTLTVVWFADGTGYCSHCGPYAIAYDLDKT